MQFSIGQQASVGRRFSHEEIKVFSGLSMDENPIHFDKAFAQTTRFGRCIVQGPLVASLIGGVLGSKLPGPGTVYIHQASRFLAPAFADELLTAHVEILKIREDKPILTLRTWVTNEQDQILIEGEAVVLFEGKSDTVK